MMIVQVAAAVWLRKSYGGALAVLCAEPRCVWVFCMMRLRLLLVHVPQCCNMPYVSIATRADADALNSSTFRSQQQLW